MGGLYHGDGEARPRRTRMRTPFVKRHTTPVSGLCALFPLSRAWRRRQSVACAALIAVHRCQRSVRHHTRLAALSPPGERVQSTVRVSAAAEQ
jgi:hypothetical protein